MASMIEITIHVRVPIRRANSFSRARFRWEIPTRSYPGGPIFWQLRGVKIATRPVRHALVDPVCMKEMRH